MKRTLCLAGFLIFSTACLAEAPPRYADKAKLLVVRDEKGVERPVADAAGWAKRRAHILASMEEVMGPLPKKDRETPLDPQGEAAVDCGTYTRQRMTISVEEGDRMPFYLLVPKKAEGKWPAVVCLHQTNGKLGKAEPAGLGGKPELHYAVHLAERSYIALAPDYVNFGEYQFDPYKNGYASATMKGIWNHRRCVDYLRSRPDVDGERIGAIGHSLGGHNAIFLGVFDERIQCIVSNCGFCSFPTYMKGDLAGWSHNGYMPRIKSRYDTKPDKMPWDFPEAIAAIAPRAFLASAPTRDNNFDLQGVKDCLTAAAPVYKLLGAADALKGNYPQAEHDFPKEARKVAYEWLDRWLKR